MNYSEEDRKFWADIKFTKMATRVWYFSFFPVIFLSLNIYIRIFGEQPAGEYIFGIFVLWYIGGQVVLVAIRNKANCPKCGTSAFAKAYWRYPTTCTKCGFPLIEDSQLDS